MPSLRTRIAYDRTQIGNVDAAVDAAQAAATAAQTAVDDLGDTVLFEDDFSPGKQFYGLD